MLGEHHRFMMVQIIWLAKQAVKETAAHLMEIGGIMTHGSVVAREYGIPAIVGVRGATTALRTGQRVRMDGNRGVIEVIT